MTVREANTNIGNINLQRLFSDTPQHGRYNEKRLIPKGVNRKVAYRRIDRYAGDCKTPTDCSDCSTPSCNCGGCA